MDSEPDIEHFDTVPQVSVVTVVLPLLLITVVLTVAIIARTITQRCRKGIFTSYLTVNTNSNSVTTVKDAGRSRPLPNVFIAKHCQQHRSDNRKLSAGVEVNDRSPHTRNTSVLNNQSSNRDEVANHECHYNNIIVECEVVDQSSTDGDFIEDYCQAVLKELRTTEKVTQLRNYRRNSENDKISFADDNTSLITADSSDSDGSRSQLLPRKPRKLAVESTKNDVATNLADSTTGRPAIINDHICSLHPDKYELYSQSFDECDRQNLPSHAIVSGVNCPTKDEHRILRSKNVRRGAIKKKKALTRELFCRELPI